MIQFGFPDSIVKLIMWCVTNLSLSILWNGSRLNNFSLYRGLRQGDPMSPYLFLLCMEILSLHIQGLVDRGIWKPVHIARTSPGLSHLLFVDDILLFAHASCSQVQVIHEALQLLSLASGLRVNLDKSRKLCSKVVTRTRRTQFTSISQMKSVASLGKYLGVKLGYERLKSEHFHTILEKVEQRLSSWKMRLLNRAGKLCLFMRCKRLGSRLASAPVSIKPVVASSGVQVLTVVDGTLSIGR